MQRTKPCLLFLLTVTSLLAVPQAASAAESYDNCNGVIASLPATISTPGTWCLKRNLGTAITSGNAITINADNVTLNCNGFRIDGLPAGAATQAIGVFATARFDITVRNCHVRGFEVGALFNGIGGPGPSSGGHVIEDNLFDFNTAIGMIIQGDGSMVRRNRVLDTGRSTAGTSGSAYGIDTSLNVDILDNTVAGVSARPDSGGNAWGITLFANDQGVVSGNRIRGLLKDHIGSAVGIINSGSARVTLRDNDLAGASTDDIGILCSGDSNRASGNVIDGFVTALLSCGDAGGNDVTP